LFLLRFLIPFTLVKQTRYSRFRVCVCFARERERERKTVRARFASVSRASIAISGRFGGRLRHRTGSWCSKSSRIGFYFVQFDPVLSVLWMGIPRSLHLSPASECFAVGFWRMGEEVGEEEEGLGKCEAPSLSPLSWICISC